MKSSNERVSDIVKWLRKRALGESPTVQEINSTKKYLTIMNIQHVNELLEGDPKVSDRMSLNEGIDLSSYECTNYNSDPDELTYEKIEESELERINKLFEKNKGIRSLVGDSFFCNRNYGDLYIPQTFKNLEYLNLNGYFISNVFLKELSKLDNLKTLELFLCLYDATEETLDFSCLKKLENLDLGGISDISGVSGIGDIEIASLQNLTNLTHLTISDTRITHDGLKSLEGLSKLKTLDLSGCCEIGGGLASFKELKNLERLNLSRSNITSSDLRSLTGLSKLKILNLSGCREIGGGLASLKKLKNLECLNLSGIDVQLSDLRSLKGLSKLKTLDLSGCRKIGGGLESLKELKNLEHLNLSRSGVKLSDLQSLSGLSKLKTLDLSGCENLNAQLLLVYLYPFLVNNPDFELITDSKGLLELFKTDQMSLKLLSANSGVTATGKRDNNRVGADSEEPNSKKGNYKTNPNTDVSDPSGTSESEERTNGLHRKK